jgi:RHS repeat-associated protein
MGAALPNPSPTENNYGQPRLSCSSQVTGNAAYTYTDQEWEAETGLYSYDARMYDPVLGRFLSADSIVPDWYDPQALDRYAYASNNPLKFRDPDGHIAFLIPIYILAAKIGAFGVAYMGVQAAAMPSRIVENSATNLKTSHEINSAMGTVALEQGKFVAGMAVGEGIGRGVAAGVKAGANVLKSARQAATVVSEVSGEVAEATTNLPKVKNNNVKVITDSDTAKVIADKFKGGAETRPIIDRRSGNVVGEITEDGAKVIRTPHTDKGTPQPHWNLENKKSGLNVHVVEQ